MKYSTIILSVILLSCHPAHSLQNSDSIIWSTTPNNNTSKIRVSTTYYISYEGLRSHCISILIQLGFEIADSTNQIVTKPKIIYNGIPARYYINCDTSAIIISGENAEASIGSSTDINSGNVNWQPVKKGSSRFGTPWFEKMIVMAEGTRGGTIHYSDK